MEALKKYKSLFHFHLLLNVAFGIFVSFSSFYHLPLFKTVDYFFYGVVFLVIQFSVFGFLYLLSINKYLFYFIFPVLFFVLSLVGFWAYSIDLSFTDGILKAVVETKPDIVYDLISFPLVVFIVIVLCVIVYFLKLYVKNAVSGFNVYFFVLALLGISGLYLLESMRNNIVMSRLPYNFFREIYSYSDKSNDPFLNPPKDIKHGKEDVKVVFVLGESVRADHLQLNGYSRQTTPLLMNKKNVVSFKNAYTPLTYTGISVPQILSNKSFSAEVNHESFSLIDIINNSKLNTCWIGNQTPEIGYETFINNSKTKFLIDPYHTIYSFNKKYDSALMPIFKKEFLHNDFVLLHMIGSHWYYENRYDSSFAKFKPTIRSKYVPSNSSQEMINSYDNTILYLDNFLSNVIDYLEKKNDNIIMIYVSDHGEFLGENGKWLHAQKGSFRVSQNPAMIVWYSDKFKEKYPYKVKALKGYESTHLPLTKVYHSVLDAFGVEKKFWIESESIFK